MKISKKELVEALEAVRPGLANRELIEQSTSFAFLDGLVVTYNDEISVSRPVPSLSGITGAVAADELYSLLGRIDRDQITVEAAESELQVRAGRVRAGLPMHAEVKLPLEEVKGKKEWKDLPKKFMEALHLVVFSCSVDMSIPLLTCVHISGKIVESSDNIRLARYELDKPVTAGSDPLLIPGSSVKELVSTSLRSPVKRIARSSDPSGWVHFLTEEGTIFSCRLFEGEYPDPSPFLEVRGSKITLPSAMRKILNRAEVFTRVLKTQLHPLDKNVEIELRPRRFIIRAQSDLGWFEESAPTKYEGSPVAFSINPSFLRQMCKTMTTSTLGKDRMKFEGDSWEHVIALETR